jgi:hypothetical protein
MIDEHTCPSLPHLVERSITAERLVTELEAVFAVAGGPPKVLGGDNGPELVSQALQQFCDGKVAVRHPARAPWGRLDRIVQQPITQGVSQTQPLELCARSPRGHLRLERRAHPLPRGVQHQLNPERETGCQNRGTRYGSFAQWD